MSSRRRVLFDDGGDTRDSARLAVRCRQPLVRPRDLGDLADELHPRRRQDDEVVADPLQVGDDVRGKQHGHAPLLANLGQRPQKIAPRQRIEAGHRLIQQQDIGLFGQREGQRQLRLLAA